MSDFAESQKLRENNDLQDLVESLVARYLYPWMKPDISNSKKVDLSEYVVLDDRGQEQTKDLNFDWGESLELEDSISKILEQQYAILTGDGDEVPYLLYSVQNRVEQTTPVKIRKKKTSLQGAKDASKNSSDFYPNIEVYGLIDSDLSDDEKEYDILLSLLEEYVLVTEEDSVIKKGDSEYGSKERLFEPRRVAVDPDAPWRFSGLCIEMESVVAAEEDKGKMFTGFLKKYLPDYEVIDMDSSDLESSLSQSNSPTNEDSPISPRRGIVFEDEIDEYISENDVVHVIPLDSYMPYPYTMEMPDSGFSSDEVNSSGVYFDKAIGTPENQREMLGSIPGSWELPLCQSMTPFWLQEDDEAQVLPTYQRLTYSKDRIKGAYKVYWVEGERVVQFTDSDDEIFQSPDSSEGNQSNSDFGERTRDYAKPLPVRRRRSSFRQMAEASKSDNFTQELYFRDSGISINRSKKRKPRRKSSEMQTDEDKSKTSELVLEEMSSRWSLIDFKPVMLILQKTLTPRQVLLATLIPCCVLGSWLGFKSMTGHC